MSHSVGHEKLLPLAVVGHRMRVANTQGWLIDWRASDNAQRRCIAACGEFISRRRMIAEVGHPQLIVIRIHVYPGGILDEGLGTGENTDRRYIATGRCIENQNGISHVI